MKRKRLKRNKLKWIIGLLSLIIIFALSFIVYKIYFQNNEFDNEKIIVDNPVKEKVYINYLDEGGKLELPINGSSGFASAPLTIYSQPNTSSDIIYRVNPGYGFTILSEQGDWWQINFENELGWVLHDNCFINLPDIIPSIVYDISNSYSSKLKSSYLDIPNVTNLSHYDAQEYSKRFNKDMYIVPILYEMAPKIFQTQQLALKEGNTLIVYEAFRPLEVQKRIVDNLRQLSIDNSKVLEGLTTYPWNIGWFISTSVSNHQKGLAVDMSLGKVNNIEVRTAGDYEYKVVTDYTEYDMPTEIHELSVDAVTFKMPVDSKSTTAWLESELSDHMNEYAIKLQKYATNSGLIPIASEWWHFNDLSIVWNGSNGNYYIENNFSGLPKIQK